MPFLSRAHTINMWYHCDRNLDHMAWGHACPVSLLVGFSFTPFHMVAFGRQLCSSSLRVEYLWNSSVCQTHLFSSFIYSTIISIWTHWYIFYTVGYNPVIYILFCCSSCSNFGHWELFRLAPLSLWHTPTVVAICFLNTFSLSGATGCPRLMLYIF